MESISVKKVRVFRSQPEILQLLAESGRSGLSIKAFCAAHEIAQGTYYNWQKKYSKAAGPANEKPGFAMLQIASSVVATLFAEVGNIKIYQPVSAAYLKELQS